MTTCAWCRGPIPPGKRRDAVTCSTPCRQARHRLTAAVRDGSGSSTRYTSGAPGGGDVARSSSGPARRFAYADPPYPGKAHYYRAHPDYAGEVDHVALLEVLAGYDGWALSTSARALPMVLSQAVAQNLDVRVGAWVRGPRVNAGATHAQNAWEPVVYLPVALAGERDASGDAGSTRRLDVLTHGVTPLSTLPSRVVGTKPPAFCAWMFDLIGATPIDTLDDLYPGSGLVGMAWRAYVEGGRARRLVGAS